MQGEVAGSIPARTTEGHGPMSAGNRVKGSCDRLPAELRFGQSMHAPSLALRPSCRSELSRMNFLQFGGNIELDYSHGQC